MNEGALQPLDAYLLSHINVLPGGEERRKMIGVYSTRESAEAAIERARQLPGFRDSPDGFVIDKHEIDQDHWTDGFITVTWTEDKHE